MLKKLILGIMLAVCSVSFTVEAASWGRRSSSSSKIDQSTPEALIECFFRAVVNDDVDTLWKLMAPATQNELIKESGSLAKAKQTLREALRENTDADDIKTIKEMLNSKHLTKQFVKEMLADKDFMKDVRKINGKWYFQWSEEVDLTSREAVAKGMLTALVNNDADMLWKFLSPAVQKAGIDECGSEEKAKADFLKTLLANTSKDEIEQIKKMMKNEKTFNELAEGFIEGAGEKSFKKIDGKWYFHAE